MLRTRVSETAVQYDFSVGLFQCRRDFLTHSEIADVMMCEVVQELCTVNLGYSDQDHTHKSIAIMDVIAVIR